MSRFLTIGTEVVAFSDAAQLKEQIAYYLAHPDEAAAIATLARTRVLAEHTYEHRARQVLDTVGLA